MRGEENGWAWGENSPSVQTIQQTRGDATNTDNAKRKRTEDTAVHSLIARVRWGKRYNSLVLMREDRGLPEPSLDDGGTAEFGGLKSTRERRLGISFRVRSMG